MMNKRCFASRAVDVGITLAFCVVFPMLAWGAPANANQQDQKSKTAAASDNETKVYKVDQKIVDACATIAGEIQVQTKPAQPRRVLVYAISHGPHRFCIPTAQAALSVFGEKTGIYSAVVSNDLADFEPDVLKTYDAVCFANTTGEVFMRPLERHLFRELPDAEQKSQRENQQRLVKNLVDYVKNGGGFFGIHAATDSLKTAPLYGEMIGAYFDGHPWGGGNTVTVNLEEPDHLLLNNVVDGPESFSIKDEIYQFKAPYDRSKLRVLLSLDLETSDKPVPSKIKRTDGDFPVAWVKSYGKGRVFYCSLGHNTSAFANPTVLKLWANGFQYAVGDLKVDDTP